MPQLVFLQVIVAAAVAALLLVVLSVPLGAKAGWRAGRALLRRTLIGLAAVIAAACVWASQTGDLARLSGELGMSEALQIGVFFVVVLGTGTNFASRYLADKAREEAGADA